MKFEVRPLSARARVVNAMLAFGLIFGVSACSGGEPEPEPVVEAPKASPGQIYELSAVWSTNALEKPAADITLSGGLSPFLAVAYQGGGLQLFDLDGEKVSEVAPYSLRQLTSGYEIDIDGARLSIFLGVNERAELHAYVYGEGLVAPVEVQIGSNLLIDVAGACLAPATGDDGRLLSVGYWKTGTKELLTFPVKAENGEFDWIDDASLQEHAESITACEFSGGTAIPFSGTVADAAILDREGYSGLITLQQTGALQARTGSPAQLLSGGGEQSRLLVNNGLSVTMPEEPRSVSALGKPLAGGYGGGLIVVGGDVSGEDKVVFIATDGLTGLTTNDADRSDQN